MAQLGKLIDSLPLPIVPPSLKIDGEIDRGAWGMVHEGQLDGKPVAVKRVHQSLMDAQHRDNAVRAFFEECERLKTIKHPHVISFLGAFKDANLGPLLVMERMKENVRRFLERHKGNLAIQEQIRISWEITQGVAFLHQLTPPMVHRDINDKNVMLTFDGVAKIGDFGRSKLKTEIYLKSAAPGMLSFMPPEALRLEKAKYDESLDVFSLGVLMLSIGTQQQPISSVFGIGVAREVERRARDLDKMSDLHPLKPSILLCLSDEPKKRPKATELIQRLDKESLSMRDVTNFKKSLEAALAKESVEVEIVKCVTLGPPEAGKTQLKSALIGKFDPVSESTPMSTKAEAVMQCYVHGKTTWEPLTQERLRKSLHTTVKDKYVEEPSPLPTPGTTEENYSSSLRNEVPASRVEKKIQPVHPGIHEGATSTSECRTDHRKALLQKQFASLKTSVEKGLKEADPAGVKGLDKIRIIHLIDSGGQPAFFDIHPVIATSRAVYLLVYNMEEGLDHKPANTYRKKDYPTKQLPNEKQSNLDMIKDSLLTLHDCKEKFITLEGELHRWFGSGDPATQLADVLPVLVVGTRKRKFILNEYEKLEKQCSYLPLWRKALHCAVTGTKLFAVDSTDPACQGVQSVREEIGRAGCTYKLPLPVSWFFCQLIFWSADKNLHVVTFADLRNLCQQEGLIANPDEFLAMVRAFHLLGIISFPYFDQELTLHDNWKPDDKPVFTNPDVLYQQVTKIIEVVYRDLEKTPMEPSARENLTKLQSSGLLDTDTLGFLDIPDELGSYTGFHAFILERLVHWGLAAKRFTEGAASTGKPTYFVPSCLPACEEEHVIRKEAPLAFTFCFSLADDSKFHYVPRGIFPHMVVQAEGMGYVIEENTKDEGCLFRDVAIFNIEPSRSNKMQFAYNVTVVDKMDHVPISIDPANASKEKSSPADCRQIVSDFKLAMEATYERIYGKPRDVTVVSKCMCDRRGTPASHLAMVICCQDGPYEMQCLLPRIRMRFNCPPKIAALLYDQGTDHQASEEPSGAVAQTEVTQKGVAISPFTVSRFLETHEDEFLEIVNPKQSLLKLKHTGVILPDVRTDIERAGEEDAKYILLEHLQKYATADTLRVYCGVAIAAKGFPRMQEFGRKMMTALPPGGTGHISEEPSGAVARTEVIQKGVTASRFLETHEDEFLEVVNPKQSLLKLRHKGVISPDVRSDIEDANEEDAKYILLEHLQRNATVDTLRVYCEVAIAAKGFPRMQELGRKMMAALRPGDRN